MFSVDSVLGVADKSFNTLLLIIGMLAIGGLAFYISVLLKYKHKFRLKEVIKGRKIIRDDRFKEFEDKDGGRWYKLLKKKIVVQTAPPEAIELDTKGKKVVEGYLLETGEVIYAKDISEPIPQEISEIKDEVKRVLDIIAA